MEFLGMIALGILGLYASGRLFGIVFGLVGKLFDNLGDAITASIGGRRKRGKSRLNDFFYGDDD